MLRRKANLLISALGCPRTLGLKSLKGSKGKDLNMTKMDEGDR